MMISTQAICTMSFSRIPQPGICINFVVSLSSLRRRLEGLKWSGFRKGRGHSTLAIKQASSFFSSAEDAAPDCVVPAKETGVRDFTGIKNVELMDLISPSKLVYTIDDQLPPLLSMLINGLPSFQLSKYAS